MHVALIMPSQASRMHGHMSEDEAITIVCSSNVLKDCCIVPKSKPIMVSSNEHFPAIELRYELESRLTECHITQHIHSVLRIHLFVPSLHQLMVHVRQVHERTQWGAIGRDEGENTSVAKVKIGGDVSSHGRSARSTSLLRLSEVIAQNSRSSQKMPHSKSSPFMERPRASSGSSSRKILLPR